MQTVQVRCAGCGSIFEKTKGEYDRQVRKNSDYQFYCTRKCFGRHKAVGNLPPDRGNVSHLDAGNRQDEFSAFRYFLNKARNRKHEYDIDLPYLKSLWEGQQGLCPLSGLPMVLLRNTSAFERDRRNPWKASLDRIDGSEGYLKGNVRFVVAMANICRGPYTDDDVRVFCRAVTDRV